MTTSDTDRENSAAILSYWFGNMSGSQFATPEKRRRWFFGGSEVDAEIRSRFGALTELALTGELDAWTDTAAGILALVLLLDQFPRNVYRGSARAFAGDTKALSLAQEAVRQDMDKELPLEQRCFLYLPFEHAESRACQERCVALFTELCAAGEHCAPDDRARLRDYLRYAQGHREVVARFGRFPHRNRALGRVSTAAESDYLSANPGGFGQ